MVRRAIMNHIENLIGKKIKRIYMNEEYLKFETDKGNVVYTVDGDCCSQSVFYDFYGVKKLLDNGIVISAKEIDLKEPTEDKKNYQESISVYGFEIVTEHPVFGEQTSVLSFRNYSNGYYGGWMYEIEDELDISPEIFDDVIETVSK
jgi:hypothetical protein